MKTSSLSAVLAIGGLIACSTFISAQDAPKDKVAKAPLPTIHGAVVSLTDDSLTVGTMVDHQKTQKKLALAPNVAITLAPDKKHETHPGQRGDVVPGVGVVLTLSADGSTVQAIQVLGRTVRGRIVAADAGTITVATKGKEGAGQEQFTLTPDTRIILSHGKDKGSVQTGTAADLKVNMPVAVMLSAVERRAAREVAVLPETTNPKHAK